MSSYDHINDEEELHKLMNATESFEERKKIRTRLREIRDKQRDGSTTVTKKTETTTTVKQTSGFGGVQYGAPRAAPDGEDPSEDKSEEKAMGVAERDAGGKELNKEKNSDCKDDPHPEPRENPAPCSDSTSSNPALPDDHFGEKTTPETTETGKDSRKEAATEKAEDKDSGETKDSASKDEISEAPESLGSAGDSAKTGETSEKDEDRDKSKVSAEKGKSSSDPTKKDQEEQSLTTKDSEVDAGAKPPKEEAAKPEPAKDGPGRQPTTAKQAAKPQGPRGAMAAFKQMEAANPAPKPNKPMVRSPSAIKQVLLDWCKAMTREYENIQVTNFSSCWNNGLAFCALIHHFYPDAFDYSQLDPKNRRYNFNLAFDTAEKLADIAPLLDVEDMVRMKNPDWKCVFTYVQSIYRHLRDHENNKTKVPAEA